MDITHHVIGQLCEHSSQSRFTAWIGQWQSWWTVFNNFLPVSVTCSRLKSVEEALQEGVLIQENMTMFEGHVYNMFEGQVCLRDRYAWGTGNVWRTGMFNFKAQVCLRDRYIWKTCLRQVFEGHVHLRVCLRARDMYVWGTGMVEGQVCLKDKLFEEQVYQRERCVWETGMFEGQVCLSVCLRDRYVWGTGMSEGQVCLIDRYNRVPGEKLWQPAS